MVSAVDAMLTNLTVAMKAKGMPYKGVLFAGLQLAQKGVRRVFLRRERRGGGRRGRLFTRCTARMSVHSRGARYQGAARAHGAVWCVD